MKLLDLDYANPYHDLPKRRPRQDNVLVTYLGRSGERAVSYRKFSPSLSNWPRPLRLLNALHGVGWPDCGSSAHRMSDQNPQLRTNVGSAVRI